MTKNSTKKIPRLRFKGFEGEWEEKKLDEVASLIKDGTHGSYKNTNSGPYLLSAKNIKNGKLIINSNDRHISFEDFNKINNHYNLENGDVLLTIVGSLGNSLVYDMDNQDITFQRSVAYLRPSKMILPKYLDSFFKTYKFQKNLINFSSVSAQPGIYLGDLKKMKICIAGINEQQKIGNFFAKLDQLIDLQTQKVEQLKKLKRGYLQKMFPQKGKSIPQLRFKGFEGEWEKSILGNLFNVKTGKSNYDKNLKSNNIYPILGSTSIIGYDSEYDYNGNFLLIARVGNAGYIYNYFGKVKITDNTIYIDYIYSKFLSYILKNENIKRLSFGSGRRLIKSSDIKKLYLKLPNKSEQKYLENLILKFENIIDLSREELTNFYKLKKSYLQKMFL